MLLDFFYYLKSKHLPVSIREHLTLLEALKQEVTAYDIDEFYYLSRSIYIKHEQHLDLYDRLFGDFFGNILAIPIENIRTEIDKEWLKNKLTREFSAEEIKAANGLEELLSKLKKIIDEQKERHEGGNKWIGTGGTSAYGNNGKNPAGVRIGGESKNRTAAKVWEKREFKNYDDDIDLNIRTMKMALRRLKILNREGIADELDLEETIDKTCLNGGVLDIKMQASRQNRVKILLLLDVGGSMDDHIADCSQLFSAAKHQFKHLEFYYFHNCVYDTLWKDNSRRHEDRLSTWEVLNKYNKEYKVIFVGDASMAAWEITAPQGSIEYNNTEAGIDWLDKFKQKYPFIVWLNPINDGYWQYTQSIQLLKEWSGDRMFPLTISGLTKAMKCLKNRKLTFDA